MKKNMLMFVVLVAMVGCGTGFDDPGTGVITMSLLADDDDTVDGDEEEVDDDDDDDTTDDDDDTTDDDDDTSDDDDDMVDGDEDAEEETTDDDDDTTDDDDDTMDDDDDTSDDDDDSLPDFWFIPDPEATWCKVYGEEDEFIANVDIASDCLPMRLDELSSSSTVWSVACDKPPVACFVGDHQTSGCLHLRAGGTGCDRTEICPGGEYRPDCSTSCDECSADDDDDTTDDDDDTSDDDDDTVDGDEDAEEETTDDDDDTTDDDDDTVDGDEDEEEGEDDVESPPPACPDDDACTAGDHMVDGECSTVPVACTDDSPCDSAVGCWLPRIDNDVCRPLLMRITDTHGGGYLYFWSATPGVGMRIFVSEPGDFPSPADTCASSVEGIGDRLAPEGYAILTDLGETEFCELPAGGYGVTHDGRCRQLPAR